MPSGVPEDPSYEDDLDALLGRVAAGDRNAFVALYDALVPEVHHLVSLVLAEPEAIASVVRTTFVELWRTASRPGFNEGSSLRSWTLADALRRSRATRLS